MIHARHDYNRIQDPAGKIKEDEPVFLLRAQDAISSEIVRQYGELLLEEGGDAAIAAMCFTHAQLMDKWRLQNGGKLPDLPSDYFKEPSNA